MGSRKTELSSKKNKGVKVRLGDLNPHDYPRDKNEKKAKEEKKG